MIGDEEKFGLITVRLQKHSEAERHSLSEDPTKNIGSKEYYRRHSEDIGNKEYYREKLRPVAISKNNGRKRKLRKLNVPLPHTHPSDGAPPPVPDDARTPRPAETP